MGLRRAGDALLHSPPSITLPSSFLRASQRPFISLCNISTPIHLRPFTTTRLALQQAPQRGPPPPSPVDTGKSDDLSASLDSLLGKSYLDSGSRSNNPPPSSSADISSAFGLSAFGTRRTGSPTSSLDFNRMRMPDGAPAANLNIPPPAHIAPSVPPRFNASTGRSIELDPAKGRDLVRGLGMLNSLVARNRVKSDVHKQRFHERNGLKRKRLKSERWRKRFKVGFSHLVTRVSDLTRKGW